MWPIRLHSSAAESVSCSFSVGALSGPAALDILRAVEQVPDAPIGPDAPAAIFGLAGGGVAGITAAEMAGTYAPERRIVGSVLQGMVVDSTTFEHFAGGELAAGFVVANALGYAAAYPEIDLDSKLTPLGRQVADVFHRSCQFVYGLTPGLPLQAVFAGGLPSDDPAFRRRYDEGRLGRGVPNAPVYLSSCPTDCLVPYSDVLWLADRYAEGGASVTIDPTECGFQDFVRDLSTTLLEVCHDLLERFNGQLLQLSCQQCAALVVLVHLLQFGIVVLKVGEVNV